VTYAREASWATRLGLLGVAAYRVLLSPLVGGTCRFSPSCSIYAEEALSVHGFWRGGRLALRRLSRCHPFGGWGYDPVPAARPEAKMAAPAPHPRR
jgi:putative membrane protein insertion efficiency factor